MRLHEKGLVYRGSYMVNWSPNLQTAVSDLEVGLPRSKPHKALTDQWLLGPMHPKAAGALRS